MSSARRRAQWIALRTGEKGGRGKGDAGPPGARSRASSPGETPAGDDYQRKTCYLLLRRRLPKKTCYLLLRRATVKETPYGLLLSRRVQYVRCGSELCLMGYRPRRSLRR